MTRPALLVACLLLAACSSARPPAGPGEFQAFRTYGWNTSVAEAQAAWNPATNQVVARAQGGFAVLDEGQGSGRQEVFLSEERRETGWPAWVNATQFVFGPASHLVRAPDGQWLPASDGLTVVTLVPGGRAQRRGLATKGFRPRPGHGRVYLQHQDHCYRVDGDGRTEEVGPGFWPEPRPGREEGLAWQTTPITERDRWTGQPPLGQLAVRWSRGRTDLLAGCTEARWRRDGSVLVATRLLGPPPEDGPWWTPGTEVVALDGPARTPRVIAREARNADINPVHPVVAVQGLDGMVRLVSWDGAQSVDLDRGENPRWNHDGTRLLLERRPSGGAGGSLKVFVFRVGG